MAWIEKIIPETIKKRCYVYLVQRYFGQYLEEKLDPSQLSVDLFNGTCSLKNLLLDVQALNELAEQQNWPLEFVDGSIEEININVPWSSLLKESSTIDVASLKVTLQPKQRKESATSMFESMWTSMTSSMQLAEDCVKQTFGKSGKYEETPYEGLELFAQAIDSILSRVKVKFSNTSIQLEHLPKSSLTGVGIIVNIDLLTYSDESSHDPGKEETSEFSKADDQKAYFDHSHTATTTRLEGITLSTVEFSSKARTVSQSMFSESSDKEDFLTFVDQTEEHSSTQAEPSTDSERNVVLFGKFSDRIEIVGRLKRAEDLDGPKVSLEVNAGSLLLFLSPRQVHLLIELAEGFCSPHNEDDSNVFRYRGRPMSNSDYERIEKDLQQQVAFPSGNFNYSELVGRHGWATGAPDVESVIDENYMPIRSHNEDAISVASTLDSSLTSSMITSCTESSRTRRRMNNIESDPTAEISRMELHLTSLAVVILHEDILIESFNTKGCLISSSVKQMQSLAEEFFTEAFAVFQTDDFQSVNEILDKANQSNQLRLLTSTINLEGDEKTTSRAYSSNAFVEATTLELSECLYQNAENIEHVPILRFSNVTSATAKSSLKLVVKRIAKTSERISGKSTPRKDLHISLNKCTFEMDITIIDRIAALLNPQPICQVIKPNNVWGGPNPVTVEESKADIKINSPSLTLILRFPKPDFRRDMNRIPWWQRNVRSDFLSLILSNFALQTTIQTAQMIEDFSILARTINVFYHEDVNGAVTHIAKAGFEDKFGTSMQDLLQDCRLNIKIVTSPSPTLDEVPVVPDPMTTSIAGLLENQKPNNGPFSSKRVIYESDTPHYKHQRDDSKELQIPGDKSEINDFIKTATDSARIQIEVVLPVVSMQLVSKHLYELIYNRINNDLLLWESSAPKPKSSHFNDNIGQFTNLDSESSEVFTPCKSVLQYESDEESDEHSKIFYSAYGPRPKQFCAKPTNAPGKDQSLLTINLQIKKGMLCLFVPVRDLMTNNVIPGQNGEFLINVEDATVFMVNGYMGAEDLGFVCLEVHNANLFHCDMLTTPSQDPPIRDLGTNPGHNLHPTIYASENGMLHSKMSKENVREMVTLCIKIKAHHETHHVKNVSIALGFNKVTLRHRMCPEPNSWFSQLLDFFNVHDYPLPGYHAKEILTELYIHFWDSAIDYRPLHLPLRAAITVGNFSISSHLSAEINTSTLRFIAEECGLFLSQKSNSKHKNYAGPVDLKRDYVNVIELGLFEISLKTCDKKNTECPHIDLRASNNIINIRTCADSARALTQLIKYFASDGDLLPQEEVGSAFSSPRHQSQQLVSVEPQEVTNLSESQHQQINDLLQDALEDVEESKNDHKRTSDLYSYNGAKLFYFPGENQSDSGKPLAQVTSELGAIPQLPSDPEDDFCFIDKEPGFNIFPKNGVPEIRWLTQDTIRLVDNHFAVPSEKSDPLKTPKSYPTPTVKYTLCEMSIIWQMYGGTDFEAVDVRKTVNFNDGAQVTFQNTSKDVKLEKKKAPKCSWVVRGGPNRDHNVLMELQLNKIRFQHEIYPESEAKASRQVLIISEFEIRDRLECSQMNKFLYHYTSQLRPKQSNANMLVIKTLHVRPDPQLRTQECCLKVSILPLRFNIDQDALQFLINFFGDLGADGKDCAEDSHNSSLSSKPSTPSHQPPVMTVGDDYEEKLKEQAKKIVDDNLMMFLDENRSDTKSNDEMSTISSNTSEDSPIYFRKVIFSPDVPIRLDYHGKHFDLTTHGPLHGLLMGLAQLNCSELRLKRITHRHGLLGMEKLMTFLIKEWLNDIKKNQIPSLLVGVGPLYSFVQLFQGIRDLFCLPFEQYKKDGRFFRGLHRGANSFTTSTAMAALELTTRLIHLIQITAETAFDMLTPGPSVRINPKTKVRRKRYGPPKDIREGVTNAVLLVKEGFEETADNILQVASHEHEQKGYSGAVGGVIRQIPPTMIKPIIIASDAVNNVLGGMRCQLVPDVRKEANQKWRNDTGPFDSSNL